MLTFVPYSFKLPYQADGIIKDLLPVHMRLTKGIH
jgi:hypothetical protein